MTLRELAWGTRARQEAAWAQTAQILCVLYNANRDPKARPKPFAPADFMPWPVDPVKKDAKPLPGSITDLKIFVRG